LESQMTNPGNLAIAVHEAAPHIVREDGTTGLYENKLRRMLLNRCWVKIGPANRKRRTDLAAAPRAGIVEKAIPRQKKTLKDGPREKNPGGGK